MAFKLWRPLRLLLLLLPLSASWTAAEDDASVARSAFPMDGDVAWVVQVSDLHISAYHPDRADDLVRLLGPALRAIRPHLLIVSGDITDAKNRKRTTSRQDEDEWITYKKSIDAIVEKGGIEKRRIFDIRGNHDTYGVPYRGSKLDFFSTYSVSSQLDRLSTISSILLQGDRSYLFLGIDDTLSVGIRYPSNLFGNPTDKRIEAVDSELQYWTSHSNVPITKVVFGHFPMSFTSSSEGGQRYENVFARQSISAYLCGHLHAKVSKQLWRYHQMKTEERSSSFWEWELGDWKESRLMRILAIDRGSVSFIDHELKQSFETSILITYPTDSRNMNILELESKKGSLRNDINVLVFSEEPILNVTARVFDSHNEFKIVEEMPLQHRSSSSAYKPLFHAKWNAENYRNASPTRYWLQVFVLDSHGKKTLSERRPFSVEGKIAIPQRSWLNRLMLEVEWEGMYKNLLWGNLAFTFFLLFIPKLLYHAFKRSPSYQRWGLSILASPVQQKNAWFWLVWLLLEGSRSQLFWFSLTLYVIWIAQMPWFWGHATSENGEIGQMYLSGWSMPSSGVSRTNFKPSNPDVMVITLPFLYLVVAPVVVLSYGLFAERSAAYLRHHSRAQDGVNRGDTTGESARLVSGSPSPGALMKLSYKNTTKFTLIKFCGGWTRRIILLACLITVTIHLKFSSMVMSAYGSTPVVLSPPLTWMPLLLLSVAAYCTMPPVDYNIEARTVHS